MSTQASGQPRRANRVAAAVRDVHPACFAFVMATGIISTGTYLLGPSWLSVALLVVGSAGLGILAIVLAARLALAGHHLATAILAAVAAAIWLVLAYGVPASLILARASDSVLGGVNGSWLLWTVATQSLSIAAATLVPAWPSQAGLLAPVASALWCVGLLLYLIVVTLILLRWLTIPIAPATLGPPYWILMGATAISVFAGARVFALPKTIPVIAATAGFTEGFSFALWAFGIWWIPLLVILGLWRHVRRQWPLTYEPNLWSIVFPLGMYSVASLTFGKAAHLAFMDPIAHVTIWVAVAAWALVAAAFLARLVRNQRQSAASTSAS